MKFVPLVKDKLSVPFRGPMDGPHPDRQQQGIIYEKCCICNGGTIMGVYLNENPRTTTTMNILLLGAPGSGKDTLADKLQSQYHYTVITPGQIYRKEANKGTKLGIWARDEYWGKGLLCPDDVTNDIIRSTLEGLSTEQRKYVVFNGYPRNVSQSNTLDEFSGIDLVLALDVDENVAVKRLLARGRADDTEEVIRQRFKIFNENIQDMRNFYHNDHIPIVDIDANSTPERVFEFAFKNILNFVY